MRIPRALLCVPLIASALTVASASAGAAGPQALYVNGAADGEGSCQSAETTGVDAACKTIATAMSKADPGAIINVAAGEYPEIIPSTVATKPVELLGSGATLIGSITFNGSVTGTSRISGFSFQRPSSVLATDSTYSMVSANGAGHIVEIESNTFDLQSGKTTPATKGRGAALRGTASWRVVGNTFLNQTYSNSYLSRTLYFEDAAPAIVHNNTFRDTGHGIFLTGSQPSGSRITSNLFDGSGELAVAIGVPTGVEIVGNDFNAWSAVYLDGSTNAHMTNNRFLAPAAMFWQVASQPGTQVSGSILRDNQITSSGYASAYGPPYGGKAIFSQTSSSSKIIPDVPDLARNWWGSDAPPSTVATDSPFNNPVISEPRIVAFSPGSVPDGFVVDRGFWPTNVVLSNQALSSLMLSSGTLSPAFAAGTSEYAASFGNAVASVTVTPTLMDATSRVTVNGVEVTSGQASAPISLTVGANAVTVEVTPTGDTPKKTYTITVTREAAPAPDPTPTPTPTPTPSPTPTPTSTPTPTEAPLVTESLPVELAAPAVAPPAELRPGTGSLVIDGVTIPVEVKVSEDGTTFVIEGAGVTLELSSLTASGEPVRLAPDGSLLVSQEGPVVVRSAGYAPESTVTLWLFSSPRLLGVFPVGANGAAAIKVEDFAGVATGAHTLQILGTSPSGEPVKVNVGVIVTSERAVAGGKPIVRAPKVAQPGRAFKATATGVKPFCQLQFWVRGSTVKARSTVAGTRTVTLKAPTKGGKYTVAVRVMPTAGCSSVAGGTPITVQRAKR